MAKEAPGSRRTDSRLGSGSARGSPGRAPPGPAAPPRQQEQEPRLRPEMPRGLRAGPAPLRALPSCAVWGGLSGRGAGGWRGPGGPGAQGSRGWGKPGGATLGPGGRPGAPQLDCDLEREQGCGSRSQAQSLPGGGDRGRSLSDLPPAISRDVSLIRTQSSKVPSYPKMRVLSFPA